MNDEQIALSWLGIIGLVIGVWLVYGQTLSAIIFGVAPAPEGPITILPGAAGSGVVGVAPGTSDVPPGWGDGTPLKTTVGGKPATQSGYPLL